MESRKLELTFKVEHADLLRNEQGELIAHVVGIDELELNQAIVNFHANVAEGVRIDAENAAARAELLQQAKERQERQG